MRMIGYVRVSTSEQSLGLDAQRLQITQEAARRGWQVVAVMEDRGISGKTLSARAGLAEALDAVETGRADGLVVAKLDRLSRSVLDFAGLVCRAQQAGWNLVVLDLGLDLATPQGRFTAHILCAMAELERELISARTRDALAAAKARGTRVGRPVQVPDKIARRIRHQRASGASFAAIAESLNSTGVPTVSGGARWYGSTVRGVLCR